MKDLGKILFSLFLSSPFAIAADDLPDARKPSCLPTSAQQARDEWIETVDLKTATFHDHITNKGFKFNGLLDIVKGKTNFTIDQAIELFQRLAIQRPDGSYSVNDRLHQRLKAALKEEAAPKTSESSH